MSGGKGGGGREMQNRKNRTKRRAERNERNERRRRRWLRTRTKGVKKRDCKIAWRASVEARASGGKTEKDAAEADYNRD